MTEPKLKYPLSEMQGKLFEMSGVKGFDSEKFIKAFMNSQIAKGLDSDFDYMQWAGKEYILERMTEECSEGCVSGGAVFDNESLYWIGYTYRYWHFYTGESSKAIFKIADAKIMNASYLGFHTLDIEAAIDRMRNNIADGPRAHFLRR